MSEQGIFQSSESTIGKLFSSNTVYIIPNYQRPYAWKEKHVIALWNDVVDTWNQAQQFRESFPGYFIGALYTRNIEKDDIVKNLGKNSKRQ